MLFASRSFSLAVIIFTAGGGSSPSMIAVVIPTFSNVLPLQKENGHNIHTKTKTPL